MALGPCAEPGTAKRITGRVYSCVCVCVCVSQVASWVSYRFDPEHLNAAWIVLPVANSVSALVGASLSVRDAVVCTHTHMPTADLLQPGLTIDTLFAAWFDTRHLRDSLAHTHTHTHTHTFIERCGALFHQSMLCLALGQRSVLHTHIIRARAVARMCAMPLHTSPQCTVHGYHVYVRVCSQDKYVDACQFWYAFAAISWVVLFVMTFHRTVFQQVRQAGTHGFYPLSVLT